jgi:hypothetical protein
VCRKEWADLKSVTGTKQIVIHAEQVCAWRRQLEAWAAAQKALVVRQDLAARE